jgi:hypothetical protein
MNAPDDVRAEIRVMVRKNGSIRVTGHLDDMLFALGMLALAQQIIYTQHKPPGPSRPDIIIPDMIPPQGGLS